MDTKEALALLMSMYIDAFNRCYRETKDSSLAVECASGFVSTILGLTNGNQSDKENVAFDIFTKHKM